MSLDAFIIFAAVVLTLASALVAGEVTRWTVLFLIGAALGGILAVYRRRNKPKRA